MNTVKAFLLCLIISLLTSCTGMITPTVLATQTLEPPTPEYTLTPSPTETPESTTTPEPTPTEVNMFTVENLTRIPKSEAEIATSCVEIASPIDNWDQYSKDMDKYLAVFDELMKTYVGPVLLHNTTSGGINMEELNLWSTGIEVSPFTCAKFAFIDEKGDKKDALLMSLVGEDKDGYFPLNIIINPDQKDVSTDILIQTTDAILKEFPIKIPGNMSMVQLAFGPISGDRGNGYNNKFLTDYFASLHNSDFVYTIQHWFQYDEFDRENGAKKAMIFLIYIKPHTNDGKLIQP